MSDTNFENHKLLPIAVIGGGLGGLALTIGLLRHGVKVHIYEASSGFSEIGAGVTFGANATTALQLIDPRLLEGFMKHATFNANPELNTTFMSLRWGMNQRREGGHKAGDFSHHMEDHGRPEGARAGLSMRGGIHRARLLDEMVALLPDDIISFGKSFDGVEELGNDMLKLCFTDGTTALASALIGCDGVRSKVRAAVCGAHIQATYARECAFRAMVPGDEATKALGDDLTLNSQLYCGYGGYIVTYPVEHGAFINIVALPQDPSHAGITWDSDDWTVPTTAEEIKSRFTDWHPPLIDVVSRYNLGSKWALFNLQHDASYFKNRMCLLGDSAHATTPHMGAGAGMAMEDAYILSHLVAAAGSVNSIEEAFRAYDAVRRPRTQQCIKRSMDAALSYDLCLPGVGDDMDAIRERLGESLNWLWHVDLEAQLRDAKALMKL
ncbi:mannitol 1-phosphate dehydrogenase [Clathrospora elynae]|uniref:Mannitol 1-phosphate dehydrogenase n=1 Tax=Clathrospora elynae TaxID=706981 RepID=A0A6A5T5U8_9PLEO|nr:mannitol 1-phosphate dehydrogenase [Clathrospora elynae]